MKILHLIRSVNPVEGGPVEFLIRSDLAWSRLGHSREVASLDLQDDPWVADCPVPTHALGHPAQRRWAEHLPWLRYGFTPRLVPWLRRHVPDFDLVIVHGLWHFAAFAARRVLPKCGRPYVVFTHGMLDPWFRRSDPVKHACKQFVWWLSEGPLNHRARAVLFTSEGERAAAAGAFWPSRFRSLVVGYGTAAAPSPAAAQVTAFREAAPTLRRPFLLFLGRLHPKKGCDLLLRSFAQLPTESTGYDLVVAGPDCDGEAARLKQLALALGIGDRVHWPGMLHGDGKWGALHGCDGFVLPSHGENFGVAVAEALACGKPVLISDRVNIAPTVEAAGAGLVAPDTLAGTTDLLRRYFVMPSQARAAMARQARLCFDDNFDVEQVVCRTAILLEGLATSGASLEGEEVCRPRVTA